ncbi:MAG: hypothetical protein U0703_02740 [Anaerolineae bacterium]
MSEQHPGYETLARRLDLALPPGARVIPPATQDPLVNTAAQIARLPELALSAEAYRRIEARMLAAFDAQQPRLLPRSQRRTAGILRWALVASLLLVVLWTGLTPTVAGSLPGEPLYSVKLFYERIEFAAATTPAAKASVNPPCRPTRPRSAGAPRPRPLRPRADHAGARPHRRRRDRRRRRLAVRQPARAVPAGRNRAGICAAECSADRACFRSRRSRRSRRSLKSWSGRSRPPARAG